MEKSITQGGPSGCAVACVAKILNIPYSKALKLFNNGKVKHIYAGFYCKEIVLVLKKVGIESEWKYITKKLYKRINEQNTIVFIKRSAKYPQGHYLCRVGNKWMDPWINMPNIIPAKSGFLNKLPDKPIYAVFVK